MKYPKTRLRRNRTDGWLRDMLAENTISAKDLIWPVFVIEGEKKREAMRRLVLLVVVLVHVMKIRLLVARCVLLIFSVQIVLRKSSKR